jgi:putative nucleotidyltransferase-like protein
MVSGFDSESTDLQRALLALLRGAHPGAGAPSSERVEALLGRYECGGYLHRQWAGAGRLASLPSVWSEALAKAHRKTALDNLAALGEFRAVGRILERAAIPFVLLKGASYLTNLYDDPAARALTDIDLLVHPADAGRVARLMTAAGYEGVGYEYESRFRRFEVRRGGEGACGFEFHWRIGLPARFRVEQDEIWRRATPCALEELPALRLADEHALLYHVAHLADHYFGPPLKWIVDLREMQRRWRLDARELWAQSVRWRVRTPLQLARMHLEKIFPEEPVPHAILPVPLGKARRRAMRRYLSREPLALLDVPGQRTIERYVLRLLLVDRLVDAASVAAEGILRPLVLPVARALGHERPPWEWPIERPD